MSSTHFVECTLRRNRDGEDGEIGGDGGGDTLDLHLAQGAKRSGNGAVSVGPQHTSLPTRLS